MRKVSIIIPIIRPASAKRCVKAIHKNAGVDRDQYEIVTAVDVDGIGCPEMVKMLTQKAKCDLVCFLGDDTVPQKDFLKNALTALNELPDGWGVVGLNTEGPAFVSGFPENSNPLAHWLADKRILEHIDGGSFFSTEYKHCWGDNELYDIANELGRWEFAGDSKIEHRHPINKTADWDEGHENAYSRENQIHDERTYYRRKRARMEKKYGTRLAIAEPLTFEMVYSQFHFSCRNVVVRKMKL